MSFFKRMFSADFRRGVAAEAAGDYSEAARAYALAGERARVAEMHLLRSERSPSRESKLQELRAAIRWADLDEVEGRSARRRIGRALFRWAREAAPPSPLGGALTDEARQVAREAAQLFSQVEDFVGAGECHEYIGDEIAAADAYQRAGDVDKLEAVLQREEGRRKTEQRVTDAFEEYRLAFAAGERDRALAALGLCVDLAPDLRKSDYRRMLESLEARLLVSGKVTLRGGGSDLAYVGAFPLVLGRETSCAVPLRDAGISRRHAEIVCDQGGFAVRDLASKNGTTLGGVTIAGTLPLVDTGELGVGEHCGIRFRVAGGVLHLAVTRGLDRGLVVVAGTAPLGVGDFAEVTFVDGRPRLSARSGLPISLNGAHAGGAVQLIRGDAVRVGGHGVEVI